MPRAYRAFVVLAFVALVAYHAVSVRVLARGVREPGPEDFALLVGGAGRLVEASEGIYKVVGQDGVLGAAFDSLKVRPNFKGYNAPIRLLGYIDSQGKIERVEVFRHRETPYYFNMVLESGLLDEMAGRTPEEVLELDAVTGATVSSKAMIDEVASDAAAADRAVFGRDHPGIRRALGRTAEFGLTAALVCVLWVVAVASVLVRNRYLKYASWALGFFVVGILMREPLSISHIFRLADGSVPVPDRLDFFLLFWGALILGAALGRVFCLRVCPFGVVQEAAYAVARGTKIDEGRHAAFAQIVRYSVFLILAFLFFGLGVRAVAEFEPYITLFSLRGGLWAWVFVAAVVAVSFISKRFWCRYFCPFGTFLEIAGWFRRRGRTADEERAELS